MNRYPQLLIAISKYRALKQTETVVNCWFPGVSPEAQDSQSIPVREQTEHGGMLLRIGSGLGSVARCGINPQTA